MTGADGKCPLKKGSLMVTFLSATIRRSGSTSMTRSTRRKGYRCGRIRMISAMRSSMGKSVGVIGVFAAANYANYANLLLSGFGWFRRSRFAGFGIHTADNLSSDVRDILIVDDAIRLAGNVEHDAESGFRRIGLQDFLGSLRDRPEQLLLEITEFFLCVFIHAIQLGGRLIDLFAQVGLRRVVQHFLLRPELGLGVVQCLLLLVKIRLPLGDL